MLRRDSGPAAVMFAGVMVEYIPQTAWKKAAPGAMLDNAIVRLDLFFLITIFMADQKIAGLRSSISELFNQFAEEQISLRLASTASFLRARDDYVTEEVEECADSTIKYSISNLRNQSCGILQNNLDHPATIPLTFREACNKIIHAKEYRFDVEGQAPDTFINPVVYFYGSRWEKKQRQQWRAVLDVVRYVEIGLIYTDSY